METTHSIDTLEGEAPAYYLTNEEEPYWVTDDEGELVFFALVQDGQVKEWVWL